ncbi:heterokaryon incompatibility protein-domain-containing protein [Nemania abortiva]|nr:heterokaryon incompatibility protein-domain-containing protein [Nemania abortiva]
MRSRCNTLSSHEPPRMPFSHINISNLISYFHHNHFLFLTFSDKCCDLIIQHSVSCAFCRRKGSILHLLENLDSSLSHNNLKELMTGRIVNRIEPEEQLARFLPLLVRKRDILLAARIVLRVACGELLVYRPFFYLEAWLYTSLFKAGTAIYSVLPSPEPVQQKWPKLPTRILQLYGTFPQRVRLIDSAPGQTGCYFALSHRWGRSKKLLLTHKTMKKLKSGISSRSLPRTFRDAVDVAGQFGCCFLWIDCLCILQDDADDWLRESTLMANIYRQAACVIAAHSASDDNEGFLSTTRSSLAHTDSRQKYAGFFEYVNESSLSQRGWVFQERILSRRLLHFTSHCLFLEDSSGIMVVDEEGLVRPPCDSPGDHKLHIEDGVHNIAQWYTVVERYSRCELTYDVDRLPAIAGLAGIFKELSSSGNFLFGLWSESVHLGLLWMQTAENPVRLGDAYRPGWSCPTWSWAAWKGRVDFPHHMEAFEPLIVLHQEEESSRDIIMLENLGPQNPVLTISGKLRILSHVQPICKETPEGSGELRIPSRALLLYKKVPEGLGNAIFEFRPKERLKAHRAKHSVFLDGISAGYKRTSAKTGLLLIAKHCDKRTKWRDDENDETLVSYYYNTYHYLVVEETCDQGYYRRIGIGTSLEAEIWDNVDQSVIHLV